jgi:alpha-L-fucosidase
MTITVHAKATMQNVTTQNATKQLSGRTETFRRPQSRTISGRVCAKAWLLVASITGGLLFQSVSVAQVGSQNFSNFKAESFKTQIEKSVVEIDKIANQGPFKPEWDSLETYEIPEWYKDAKLGIFIHWGVYTVPEFGWEWYPRWMYIDSNNWRGHIYKHHKETYGDHSKFGYKDFVAGLKAEKFNADEWVNIFKDAGARYVVPVAEHHDGFAMYDCTFSQWTSVRMGPKRDIVGELRDATRKQDLRFGVSSHRAFNWIYYLRSKDYDNADPRFEGLYGRDMPQLYKPEAKDYKNNWPDHDDEFKNEWLARTSELVDKYQADLIWFDFGINHLQERGPKENPFADHLKRFAAYYYNTNAKRKNVPVLNYKFQAYPEKAAVLDLERSKLNEIRDLFWQTDTSLATNTWSYVESIKYKPVNRIVDDLVDIVSKNGCLLLNVCPRADGSIPPEQKEMLKEIGVWMKTNGEAIYDTRPFKIFGEGPTTSATGHLSEKKNKPYGAKDFRFTVKGETLYALALGVSSEEKPDAAELVIESLKSGNAHKASISSVELLGSNEKLTWKQTDKGLQIEIPESLPSKFATGFRIK